MSRNWPFSSTLSTLFFCNPVSSSSYNIRFMSFIEHINCLVYVFGTFHHKLYDQQPMVMSHSNFLEPIPPQDSSRKKVKNSVVSWLGEGILFVAIPSRGASGVPHVFFGSPWSVVFPPLGLRKVVLKIETSGLPLPGGMGSEKLNAPFIFVFLSIYLREVA